MLQDTHGEGLEEVTHCTTDYLNFCMDVVVPTRTVRCFPKNKPWVTSDAKTLLNKKKRAFKEGDLTDLRRVRRELKEHRKRQRSLTGRKWKENWKRTI